MYFTPAGNVALAVFLSMRWENVPTIDMYSLSMLIFSLFSIKSGMLINISIVQA